MVARDRRERGVKLNYPESVVLLSTWVIERAREGLSVSELMVSGREVLGSDDVMEGVAEMLADVHAEAAFPDGGKLVMVPQPITGGRLMAAASSRGPGDVRVADGTLTLNADRTPSVRLGRGALMCTPLPGAWPARFPAGAIISATSVSQDGQPLLVEALDLTGVRPGTSVRRGWSIRCLSRALAWTPRLDPTSSSWPG
jgi:urease gamma subunit